MSQVAIDDATIDGLRSSISGQLVTPEDQEYEQARKVWNGMIDRHPALIADRVGPRRRPLDARLQQL
jgi:hypothetical protein